MAFLMAQTVKRLPTMQETQVRSLGRKDRFKDIATYSSILAWEIPRTEKPGGLQSLGLQRVRYDLATEHTLSEIIKSSLALLDLFHIPFVSHSFIESTFNVPDTAIGTWDEQQQRVLLSRRQ